MKKFILSLAIVFLCSSSIFADESSDDTTTDLDGNSISSNADDVAQARDPSEMEINSAIALNDFAPTHND